MDEVLRSFVSNIDKLPTIPLIAQEILRLSEDDRVSIDSISEIVEKDPAITAKILSVANSAFFGIQSQTDMLSNAIMRVGLKNIKNIAVGISIMTVLDDKEGGKSINYNRIFSHSVAVGLTAQHINRQLKTGFSDDIIVNGMLHDLGYLVLNRYYPETYTTNLMRVMAEKGSLLEAEKALHNFTHADVGQWLASEWKLPETVQDVNLYHHAPSLAKKNSGHSAIIHLADYMTAKNILSPVEKDPNYPLDHSCAELLGITEKDIAELDKTVGDLPFPEELSG